MIRPNLLIFLNNSIPSHVHLYNATVYAFAYVYCKVLINNILGHGIKVYTVLLYIDSIFIIQDFTFSKTD